MSAIRSYYSGQKTQTRTFRPFAPRNRQFFEAARTHQVATLSRFRDSKRPVKELPTLPKRAVITAGMPYGNKTLHIGHVAVFFRAAIFAQLLRDNGTEVFFGSGTDCYGTPITVTHQKKVKEEGYQGSLNDFALEMHHKQKAILDRLRIGLDIFSGSSLADIGEIHRHFTAHFMMNLHRHGYLKLKEEDQFYDPVNEIFLIGRQVKGKCPNKKCANEEAWGEECGECGAKYPPGELINPIITTTGKPPKIKPDTNWAIELPAFQSVLKNWVDDLSAKNEWQDWVLSILRERFEPPRLILNKNQMGEYEGIKNSLPQHQFSEGTKKSFTLVFETPEGVEKAKQVLSQNNIQSLTGKTLYDSRMTGKLPWGVPVPVIEGLDGLTLKVWPDSLWFPIANTAFYEWKRGNPLEDWSKWWCTKDSRVFHFTGKDTMDWYGIVWPGMILGNKGPRETLKDLPEEGEIQMPTIIGNYFLKLAADVKMSSSKGNVISPEDLLQENNLDRLRLYTATLALKKSDVEFNPDSQEIYNKTKNATNQFGNAVKHLFDLAKHKDFNGVLTQQAADPEVIQACNDLRDNVITALYQQEYANAVDAVVKYANQQINKAWNSQKPLEANMDGETREKYLANLQHQVRTITALMHGFLIDATEIIQKELNVGDNFFDWRTLDQPLSQLFKTSESHQIGTLPEQGLFPKPQTESAPSS